MANGIDKKALFKLKSEPYLKPISDLGVGFYNLDENTAILRFQLSNTKGPLLIHENNLTAYAYFESSNGSVSDVIELEIEDSFNGIVTITLDKEFLQASTSTKVKGQVYIGVNNVDGKPEYNEVAVFREFNFEVADALINKISAFTKIEYIKMFDQLKTKIEATVREIEEAIANGADYVTEMKSVLQQGIETITQLVANTKTDIQAYITQAKADLDTTKNNAIEDITTLSDNAKSSVQDTADTSINSITAKTTEATEHVDAKVTEFNQTVLDNGFLSPEMLTSEIEALDWQRYKLTADDGSYKKIELNGDIEALHALSPGRCYLITTPITGASSTAGYAKVETRENTSNIKLITFRPYNSTQVWVKRFYNTWNDWERVDSTQTDTGWVPFQLINGATANASFKAEVDNGFDCAYRIIKNGSVTEKRVRINASNVTHQTVVANLPANFAKNVQFHNVRVPINKGYGLVGLFPSGSLYVYVETDKRDIWNETDYFYGEFSWVE